MKADSIVTDFKKKKWLFRNSPASPGAYGFSKRGRAWPYSVSIRAPRIYDRRVPVTSWFDWPAFGFDFLSSKNRYRFFLQVDIALQAARGRATRMSRRPGHITTPDGTESDSSRRRPYLRSTAYRPTPRGRARTRASSNRTRPRHTVHVPLQIRTKSCDRDAARAPQTRVPACPQ